MALNDPECLGLAAAALDKVISVLNANGSSLAGDSLSAIKALLRVFEDGLKGNISNDYHLSSIDPGIGKTLSVSTFLKVWRDSGFNPRSSVLVAVSRLEEINTYLMQSGLAAGDFAVLTSDPALNGQGVIPQGRAPILFTTQQKIQSRLKSGGAFDALSEFHFNGAPRVLRIWDESMIPEEGMVLHVDELGLIPIALWQRHPAFAEAVRQLQRNLMSLVDGDQVTIPDDIAAGAPPQPERPKSWPWEPVVEKLRTLAGKTLTVTRDGGAGAALIGGGLPFPADFPPAIILDASGRVRPTYRLWEQHRRGLERLPPAVNDYRQLHIHLWQRGSGKASLSAAGVQQDIAEALGELIGGEKGEADWLIIHYRDHKGLVDAVKDRLPEPRRSRVKALTWGRHHGTNAFADVPNVVVIGQLTYRPIDYTALACAASGLSPGNVAARIDMEDLRWGEFQHHLLQALCRASVRRSRNGVAGPCRAYVIATPSAQTESRVRETFPHCRLVEWVPVVKPMSDRVRAAIAYLTERFVAGVHEVSKSDLREHLGMAAKNLGRDVIAVQAFQDHLSTAGLREETRRITRKPSFSAYEE